MFRSVLIQKIYLLTLVFLLSLFHSLKAQQLSVLISSVNDSCSSIIEVPVKFVGFKDAVSAQFSIGWDTSKIEYNSISQKEFQILALSNANFGVNRIKNGVLTFSWNDASLSGKTLSDSSIVFTIKFNVKKKDSFKTDVYISNEPTKIEFVKNNFTEYSVLPKLGSINYKCESRKDLILYLPPISDSCKKNIYLPLKCIGFKDLASLQFSLSWDTAKLNFKNVDFNPQNNLSLSANNFGLNKVNEGRLSFSWADVNTLSGKSVNDSSALFFIIFEIKSEKSTLTKISIDSFPTLIESVDNNLENVTLVFNSGDILIKCKESSFLNLFSTNISDSCNKIIELPIKTSEFVDILSLQHSIIWDTSRLQYVDVILNPENNLNISKSNFGDNKIKDGILTFGWNDVDLEGKSLKDSTILFKIRFNIISKDVAKTSVKFSNTPTSFEAIAKNLRILELKYQNPIIDIICNKCYVSDTLSFDFCKAKLPVYHNGREYNSSSITIDTIKGAGFACDTIRLTRVNINEAEKKVYTQTICNSELPYNYFKHIFFSQGEKVDTVSNISNTCDTIRTIKLIVNQNKYILDSIQVCESQFPFRYLGRTFFSDSTVVDTLKGSYQVCDTIRTLVISKKYYSKENISITICESKLPFFYLGYIFPESGIKIDTVKGSAGACDTIRTIKVEVQKYLTKIDSFRVCANNLPFLFEGKLFTSEGVKIDTLRSITMGCDTIRTLKLFVDPLFVKLDSIEVCENKFPYNFRGYILEKAGILIDTIKSRFNICDTIFKLIIRSIPSPKSIFTTDSVQCLNGNSFTFLNTSIVNSSFNPNFKWNFGDGQVGNIASPKHSFKQKGIFNVQLVVIYSNGCVDSIAKNVIVNPNPNASFEIDDSIQCLTNNLFTFANKTTISAGAVSYKWNFGDGSSSSSINSSKRYSIPGYYAVSLLAISNNFCKDSVSNNIFVAPQPLGKYYDTVYSKKDSINNLFIRKLDSAIYNWSPVIYLDKYNQYNPKFRGDESVIYNIKIIDKYGCVINDTLPVYFIEKSDILLPKAFTPNKDGVNDAIRPLLVAMKEIFYFKIYNKWGLLIFESKGAPWDGRFKNVDQPIDTYTWVASGKGFLGEIIKKSGRFLLIR